VRKRQQPSTLGPENGNRINRSRLSFFIHPKALSNVKARKELGFEPAVNFRKGIERAAAWYLELGWL
jgi:nucleoside-diphosphate-sugar epimerase